MRDRAPAPPVKEGEVRRHPPVRSESGEPALDAVLRLQRLAGNAAVSELLSRGKPLAVQRQDWKENPLHESPWKNNPLAPSRTTSVIGGASSLGRAGQTGRPRSGHVRGFVKDVNSATGESSVLTTDASLAVGDVKSGLSDRMAKAMGHEDYDSAPKEDQDKIDADPEVKALAAEGASFDIATASADSIGIFLNTGLVVKKFIDGDRGKWDTYELISEVIGAGFRGAMDITALGASIETLKGDDTGWADASVLGWSLSEFFEAVKKFTSAVKGLIDFVAEGEHDTGTKFKTGMGSATDLLAVVNGLVRSIKLALDFFEKATGPAADIAPGLGICIAAATTAVKVYDIHIARKSFTAMQKEKRDVKSKNLEWFPGGDTKKGKPAVLRRKTEVEQELAEPDLSEAKRVALTEELRKINEYLVFENLQHINTNRMRRAGADIAIQITKAAGDAATLSGVGAMAGVPLKAFATGASVSMSLGRRITRWGNDKAAKEGASPLVKALFTPAKSTAEKQKAYTRNAKFVFDMLEKAAVPMTGRTPAGMRAEKKFIDNLIKASGADLAQFYRPRNDAPAKLKLLTKSMKKRD